ncbi:MAG: CsbD family protein [Proteobacteria bacterium]|uniref:CsbD family protein n=1 Tax=Novilysobacter longmucuonensis TaxID=3098603 RepID=UPI002A2FD5ED|nr:CsbD family protein [Pseudomonadota bacterium]
MVDKNRQEGSKHQVSGAMKEGAGKITGDRSQEAKGNLEKNAGKVQREVGKASDDARDERRH